jgi:hypothetical protein
MASEETITRLLTLPEPATSLLAQALALLPREKQIAVALVATRIEGQTGAELVTAIRLADRWQVQARVGVAPGRRPEAEVSVVFSYP